MNFFVHLARTCVSLSQDSADRVSDVDIFFMPTTLESPRGEPTETMPHPGPTPITFEGCDYHALSTHPDVLAAIVEAVTHPDIARASTSASRTTTGDTPVHRALETDLRDFLGTPAALLCPDGYTANMIAMQALIASGPHRPACVILEPDTHASLHDAAKLASIPCVLAHRNRPDNAAMIATAIVHARNKHAGPILWATDGVFTAHGRVAPLDDILSALGPCDLLLVDDCHGFSTMGPGGRGTAHAQGVAHEPRLLLTSTLAKGLGASGGFIAGPEWFINAARAHSDVYIGTTPTSPVLIHAARAALRVLRAQPQRIERLGANIESLHTIATAAGIPGAHPEGRRSQILAFTLSHIDADAFDNDARTAGLRIPRMRYPGGPSPEYHRIAVRATHTTEVLDTLATLLAGRRYL